MRDQFFICESIRRLSNNFSRKIQNLLCTAIIFYQSHYMSTVIFFKIRQVRRQSSLKLINRLIIIPHCHNHRLFIISQSFNDRKLRRVCILKLIQHDKLISLFQSQTKTIIILQNFHCLLNHIVKIIQAIFFKIFLITSH